jgi:peptide/nickel transport system substrate-binding protein
MKPGRRKGFLGTMSAVAAASLIAAGCGSSANSPSSGGTVMKGGTATVGVITGTQPNYIWPFTPLANLGVPNTINFQWYMYRPLYMFGNNGNSVLVNYPLSPANAPVYTDGGKTVTITMKGWKWSDGEPVSGDDVGFWLNMMKAEKANYGGYTPGTLPDNLASWSSPSQNTIVLHLTKAYADTWFTYNQLAEITPMPQAWDVTSVGAKAGSGNCTTSVSACAAVYNFLSSQAKSSGTYASSPIWSVVDGPWKLSSFNSGGNDTWVPNKNYSGSPKPRLSSFSYVPYTSDTAFYTALKSGAVDAGEPGVAIPSEDLPMKPANSSLPASNPLGSGYTLDPFYSYAIAYAPVNENNTTLGPAFKQLYVRQALAYVTDQPGLDRAIYRGYAYPTTGPVPPEPVNTFEPAIEKANGGQGAYPFSITKAKDLLTSHGWTEQSGVMTCETPAKCGAGVAKGTQLKFSMDYTSGFTNLENQVTVYKSDASEAGIQITVEATSFNTELAEIVPTNHTWTMADISGWAFNGPGFLPTGEPLFETNATSNSSGYSNPEMDKIIGQVEVNSSLSLFHQYATFTAQQLPFIWMPQSYWVQPVKSTLHGVAYNPMYTFLPEYWYFTK